MLLSETIKNLKNDLSQIDASIQDANNYLDPSNDKDNETILALMSNRQHVKEMLDSVKAAQEELLKPISDMPHGGPGRQDWPPPSRKS